MDRLKRKSLKFPFHIALHYAMSLPTPDQASFISATFSKAGVISYWLEFSQF